MQLPLVFPPLDASNQQVNQCRLVPAQQHLSLPCNTSFTAFILDRESQIQDVFCWQINLSTFSPRVPAVGEKSRITMLIYSRSSCCVKMTLQTTSLKVLMSSPLLGTGTTRSQKSRRVCTAVCVFGYLPLSRRYLRR